MRFNRIFLCLFAFSLLFSFSSCQTEKAPVSGGIPKENAEQKEMEHEDFLSQVTFLGDSTTAHMKNRAKLLGKNRENHVWATKDRYLNLDPRITYAKIIRPDTGEAVTIEAAAAALKPPFLVITLGIDYGVYYYREYPLTFRFYYEKLLDAIKRASPDTVVILQSVFPVGRNCRNITNEMVDKANRTIREMAEERGLYYLDSASVLKDEEGYLAPQYCYSDDGIHLTEEAYRVTVELLLSKESDIRKSGT